MCKMRAIKKKPELIVRHFLKLREDGNDVAFVDHPAVHENHCLCFSMVEPCGWILFADAHIPEVAREHKVFAVGKEFFVSVVDEGLVVGADEIGGGGEGVESLHCLIGFEVRNL